MRRHKHPVRISKHKQQPTLWDTFLNAYVTTLGNEFAKATAKIIPIIVVWIFYSIVK